MRQRAQAGHLIFVILHGVCGGDGHRAEDIQMPAHEMIDAEVRRNNVRVRNLLFELPIQKPVAQAILPCKGFVRDLLEAGIRSSPKTISAGPYFATVQSAEMPESEVGMRQDIRTSSVYSCDCASTFSLELEQ